MIIWNNDLNFNVQDQPNRWIILDILNDIAEKNEFYLFVLST